MRVTNDDGDGGPFDELVRLQADFQARLAEETMRYLRRLQAAVGPAVPGTVVVPDPDTRLAVRGAPGGEVALEVQVANSQGVHCIVTPAVSPFLHVAGATWYPAVELDPATALVGPGETADLRVRVALPDGLPTGEWHGALLLHGFRGAGVATTITVDAGADAAASATVTSEAGAADPDGGGPARGPAGKPATDADAPVHDPGRITDAGTSAAPGLGGPGTPLAVSRAVRSAGRPSGGPVRPRIAHGAPPRGRREQLVLPAVPPHLAERLEDAP